MLDSLSEVMAAAQLAGLVPGGMTPDAVPCGGIGKLCDDPSQIGASCASRTWGFQYCTGDSAVGVDCVYPAAKGAVCRTDPYAAECKSSADAVACGPNVIGLDNPC